MKRKILEYLHFAFFASALISLIICIWDVIIGGLFVPATDITHGLGLALSCSVCGLAVTVFQLFSGIRLSKKLKSVLKTATVLMILSLIDLILCLVGGYNVIPALLGIVLPIVMLYCLKK